MALPPAILHQQKQYVYLNIRMPVIVLCSSIHQRVTHSSGSYSKIVLSEVAVRLINSEIQTKNVYYKSYKFILISLQCFLLSF